MTHPTTEGKEPKTDNALIAEFMGAKVRRVVGPLTGEFYDEVKLTSNANWQVAHYETSWDWLMPVVEKINSLPKTTISIYPQHCIISVDGSAESGAINSGDIMPLIDIVYPAIVKFIKWYNQNTNP